MGKNRTTIRPYQSGDKQAVIDLWFKCQLVVPLNNPEQDIERKLLVNPEWFLVTLLADKLVATIMIGYEGHRGWVNYLAVDPEYRRQGLGRLLMLEAEKILRAAGCPKICLQVRNNNKDVIAFYKAIGYTLDDVIGMGKRLEEDQPYSK
jgi:ribosomal protein S18 acetylase RimI-like enzyme